MEEKELRKIFQETEKELFSVEEIKKITSNIPKENTDNFLISDLIIAKQQREFLFRLLSKILCSEDKSDS